jgi:predicted regulator of Ras-like GTPase activity (Roadblock/LC7/MglB family)
LEDAELGTKSAVMSNYAPLLCSEFKLLVQQVLDGQSVSEGYKRRIREHRESCDVCCNFHDGLLGVAALAPEIAPPEEFQSPYASRLWNEIFTSIDDEDEDGMIARTVSLLNEQLPPPLNPDAAKSMPLNKLDASKIDSGMSGGPITDIGKFLLDQNELEWIARVIDINHQNPRIDRVSDEVRSMLDKLQDTVAVLPTVVGTMVLSPDGNVVDSRMSNSAHQFSTEELGVWCTAAYHNAQAASSAFGFSGVKQIVSRTDSGFVIIANLQGITLVVLIDGAENEVWDVVRRITALTK